jgi:hypothetical protein
VEGENPRCACGSVFKKNYFPPVFRYLDFLHIDQPAVSQRTSGED